MGSEILEPNHGAEKPRQVGCEDQQQDLAALQESLKQLPPPSSSGFDVEIDDCAKSGSGDEAVSPNAVEQVDSFLKEALSSRNRITVLRLEQEIEKFLRNSKQQQLEFMPMPSSYVRLAAHRVAQHYHLQSTVVDYNAPEGTRIVVRKTSETRFPDVRLVDIPSDSGLQDKSVPAPLEKVAIMQRATMGSKANGYCNGSSETGRMNPAKTVEERKEEYNKARARIFSSGDLVGQAAEEQVEADAVSVIKEEESSALDGLHELVISGESVSDGEERSITEDDFTLRVKLNSSRVAIFRDREKDRKDPDYDRSYNRYSQRFHPGFGINLGSFSMHGMYVPVLNYSNEFSHLDGPRPPQIRVDQTSYLTPQHIRHPAVGTASSPCLGHPDALFGHFIQGHLGLHTSSDIYLQRPRFIRPGPYSHTEERFQHSSLQPCLQPEESFRGVRRQ